MKVVLLAGGLGSRLQEETVAKPKPLVEIGNGLPILWHIMKYYSMFGHKEFIICTGYKGEMIKDFFLNYHKSMSNMMINLKDGSVEILSSKANEDWKVTVIDTGLDTKTAGRIKQVEQYLNNEPFMLSYGDGLSNVNLNDLLKHHKKEGKLITLTGISPISKFGNLKLRGNSVISFEEKSTSEGWVNGGFFCCQPKIFDYITKDDYWENSPMKKMVEDSQVSIYKHFGWWQCMDTIREKDILNYLWASNTAPWKIW